MEVWLFPPCPLSRCVSSSTWPLTGVITALEEMLITPILLFEVLIGAYCKKQLIINSPSTVIIRRTEQMRVHVRDLFSQPLFLSRSFPWTLSIGFCLTYFWMLLRFFLFYFHHCQLSGANHAETDFWSVWRPLLKTSKESGSIVTLKWCIRSQRWWILDAERSGDFERSSSDSDAVR